MFSACRDGTCRHPAFAGRARLAASRLVPTGHRPTPFGWLDSEAPSAVLPRSCRPPAISSFAAPAAPSFPADPEPGGAIERTGALARRDFLRGAVALGGVGLTELALADLARAGAVATTAAWELDPAWGYPRGAHGRTSCNCRACVTHAANKIFATQSDAVAGRAHAGCLCTTRRVELPIGTYDALFSLTGAGSADRRDPAVAAILASADDSSPDPGAAEDGGTGGSGFLDAAATGADFRRPVTWMAVLALLGIGARAAAGRRPRGTDDQPSSSSLSAASHSTAMRS